jgi:quercetin dioxygenase-like cupin family protein
MVQDKKMIDTEKISAKVANLSGLVNYQENSIVSRTLIDKETGTVTLFAFDEGQAMSEHTAPFDALVYLIDGEGNITISGRELHLREGDMTIILAKKPHAVKAVKRFKMLLIMVRS